MLIWWSITLEILKTLISIFIYIIHYIYYIITVFNNFQDFDINRFSIDKNLIDRVLKYASIKNIWKKNLDNDEKIENILSEVVRDLKNHELEIRIQDLEEKFSKDLSEETFNQLKELKKLQNLN